MSVNAQQNVTIHSNGNSYNTTIDYITFDNASSNLVDINALQAEVDMYKYYNGVRFVDLGLPSGLKWAMCNIDANNPEDCGGLYVWAEIETKSVYTWGTYKWMNIDEWDGTASMAYSYVTKYNTSSKKVLELSDDVVHIKLGSPWRIPTNEDFTELIGNCFWVYTENYKNTGVTGVVIFKPKNSDDKGKLSEKDFGSYDVNTDIHIFLPATKDGFKDYGKSCIYWTSTAELYKPGEEAITMQCYYASGTSGIFLRLAMGSMDRYNGCNIRPVVDKKK